MKLLNIFANFHSMKNLKSSCAFDMNSANQWELNSLRGSTRQLNASAAIPKEK